MRSVCVVVIDVVDNEPFEVVLVPDDGSVEQFVADGSDPAFGVAVGHRCPDLRVSRIRLCW